MPNNNKVHKVVTYQSQLTGISHITLKTKLGTCTSIHFNHKSLVNGIRKYRKKSSKDTNT